jgi:hypothetical protein
VPDPDRLTGHVTQHGETVERYLDGFRRAWVIPLTENDHR